MDANAIMVVVQNGFNMTQCVVELAHFERRLACRLSATPRLIVGDCGSGTVCICKLETSRFEALVYSSVLRSERVSSEASSSGSGLRAPTPVPIPVQTQISRTRPR